MVALDLNLRSLSMMFDLWVMVEVNMVLERS